MAVLDARVQYRAATLHGLERFDLANAEQAIRSTFKAKNSAAPCPWLGQQCFGRSFGDHVVWKVASGEWRPPPKPSFFADR